ncbi:unnamed protein product [Mucor hiemalis]
MLASLLRRYSFIKRPLSLSPKCSGFLQQNRFVHHDSDKWLPSEDALLQNFVKHNGKKWNEFVQHCLPNRSPSQCQTRWTDVLNPVLKRGPFSSTEKILLNKGVSEFGSGQWSKINEHYLPQRSPRRIANEWSSTTPIRNKPWTKSEDDLVLQGVAQFGHAWSKISTQLLPWRNCIQIRNHYRLKLDPKLKKEKWSDSELDLLLRRTIVFGQDWNKVAEGLPGRTPENCTSIWISELDPALNKGPWSIEETRLFWERVYYCQGNFVKESAKLFRKFWSTVRDDKEFTLFYGDALSKEETENSLQWRTRIAKIVVEWLSQETSIRRTTNKGIALHQTGPWNKEDLLKLDEVVKVQLNKKGADQLDHGDWKKISEAFVGRDPRQCKYQYIEHLSSKPVIKGEWTVEEDALLTNMVNQYGTTDWDKIVDQIPNRNKRQCLYRWHRVLKYDKEDRQASIIKKKRLTDNEKLLIKEGVQMFGPNWTAIRETYLPNRTTDQLMRWWNFKPDDTGSIRRTVWTEEEDKSLLFAVNKLKNNDGEITSWSQVSKLIEGRTPKQCRTRFLYTLEPNSKKGHWSYEEEMQLLEIVQKVKLQKNKSSKKSIWHLVAKELKTGRSDWACRAKYDYMQRKGHRFAF